MGNRFNWTSAVEGKPQGRGGSGGGDWVSRFEYEIGEYKRVIIPALIDPESGEESPIIFQQPVHDIDKGTFTLEGSKGGKYTPFQIRCMNPLSQTDPKLTKEIAERKQFCVPCLMASLSNKEYFAEMDATFGSVEGYQAATKEEKKVFNDKMKNRPQIRESYDSQERKNKYSMEMLLLVLETVSSKEKDEFGIESDVTTPVLDEKGQPKYKAVLFKVSDTRLGKFTAAVASALKSRSLSGAKLHKLEENGTQILTTFVDFELEFPVRDTKMKSAAEMVVRAVRDDETIITPELIEAIQGRSEELLEKAEKAFDRNNANLGQFTTEQYVTAMTDGGARYKELVAKYMDDNDRLFISKVLRAANGEKDVFKKSASTTESTDSVQDIKTAPTESATQTAPTNEAPILDDADDLLSI